MLSKIKLDKNIYAAGWVSLLTDVSSEIIYPLLPIFLSGVLGAGVVLIGLVEGFAESLASILKFFSGVFSDKIKKRKPIILAGYSLSALVKPFFYIVGFAWQVLFIRAIDRAGKGLRTAPRDALIADSCVPEIRGKAFGVQRAMDQFGAFLGSLIAFFMLPVLQYNYRLLFLLAAIPAFIAVAVIDLFLKEKEIKARGLNDLSLRVPPTAERSNLANKALNPEFKIFILIFSVFTLGNSSNAFLLLRVKDLGVSVVMIPIIWMFFNLISALTSVPFGRLSDKIGRKNVILLGFLIYAVVYFGFAFSSLRYHAWLLFAVYGVYYGMSEGVMKAYIADIVGDSTKRATAYGIFNAAEGLMLLPASLLLGVLWHAYGHMVAFSCGAFLALFAALFFALANRKFASENF